MSDVRTTPLTADEIESFWQRGFIRPGRILDDAQVEKLRDALDRVRGQQQEAGHEYDLLEPLQEGHERPESQRGKKVGFLFNLWLLDDTFKEADFNPVLAGWAAQLVGAPRVRLLEDGAIYKDPEIGGTLNWHQDFPYWPLAQPNEVTAWIALDTVNEENGAMKMAVGSHLFGERLPMEFTTTDSLSIAKRPKVMQPIEDPEKAGFDVETISLGLGELSMHHSLTWHASGPNRSTRPRRGFVPRYAADGVIWLGSRRFPYNYSDEEVGIEVGAPLGGKYFPLVPA